MLILVRNQRRTRARQESEATHRSASAAHAVPCCFLSTFYFLFFSLFLTFSLLRDSSFREFSFTPLISDQDALRALSTIPHPTRASPSVVHCRSGDLRQLLVEGKVVRERARLRHETYTDKDHVDRGGPLSRPSVLHSRYTILKFQQECNVSLTRVDSNMSSGRTDRRDSHLPLCLAHGPGLWPP